MSHKDDVFIKTFSAVVGGLALFAILLMVFANIFHDQLTREVSEARTDAVQSRIAPIGAVYAGESGAQALAAATQAKQTADSGASGPMSGQQVYQNVCAACHDAGVGGAPKMEASAWQDRLAKGEDTLVSHAIDGFQGEAGMMPAKGGRPDLSDEEVRKAVEHMMAQVEGG